MLAPDQPEMACTSVDITPDGMQICCQNLPYRGQRVVAYFDQLGRVQGVVARICRVSNTFGMVFEATDRKKSQLAAVVSALAGEAGGKLWNRPVETASGVRVGSVHSQALAALPADKRDSGQRTFGDAHAFVSRKSADPFRSYLDFD
jgi:hypothetical protein